ncbi:MAG: DUF3343 domain-containing protein [Candidatus Cloacimonetes bacterium]|nr:DUF3343 domain-containing protein [Candidatus Cloacimonadota bacterium]
MNSPLVITFPNTHQALKAEDFFKLLKLEFELIPTPREISAECGFALLVYNQDSSTIIRFCSEKNITLSNIFICNENKGVKNYEKSY